MKAKLFFFLLVPALTFSQIQIGSDIDGEAAEDFFGESISLSSDGTIMAVGASDNDGVNGIDSGHVRVFENQGGSWVQIGADIDGEAADDYSGVSVSLSSDGSIVAIGAWDNDGVNGTNSGHVRVYENQAGTWVQMGSDIDGEATNDFSGISICLSSSGTILAIGADNNNGINGIASGHVRIFENQGGNWIQIGSDIDGEAADDYFGSSLSLSDDGSIIGIGALANDGVNGIDSGHVRVYQNQGGDWIQIGADIDGEAADDFSGSSVSLSSDGSRIAIGSNENDGINGTDSGHVRVYENQAGSWIQIGADIDGESADDGSGVSVSLSGNGDVVAIGAFFNDGVNGIDSGHTRIYQLQAGNWMQMGMDIDGESAEDFSGYSISLSTSGTILAVSGDSNANGIDAGHVRVFNITSVLSTHQLDSFNFSIYPNPVKDILTIELQDHIDLQIINIYNMLGENVGSYNTFRINTSHLQSGIYSLEIVTSQGTYADRMIKM